MPEPQLLGQVFLQETCTWRLLQGHSNAVFALGDRLRQDLKSRNQCSAIRSNKVARTVALAAIFVLFLHLIWLALVIFGAFWTRGRPVLTALHVIALFWGIVVELSPWPCPLTLAEQYFEARVGSAYQGGFLLHYLDAIVYPNLPGWIVTTAGVGVCALNLGIYGWRLRKALEARRMPG